MELKGAKSVADTTVNDNHKALLEWSVNISNYEICFIISL